ncbi:MAG: alpha-L-fucosidase [Planctomycetes bacterium]|nr:alpha-L-fucosidase [Planctomycetota bacterium]
MTSQHVRRSLLSFLALATAVPAVRGQGDRVPIRESEEANRERMRWFEEARFGMFVHWGPVSLAGTEIGWSRGKQIPRATYDALPRRFDPVRFDANEWVRIAKAAGMRYFVITAKHHDGFCLWDSAVTDHDVMETPFGRDVVKELAAACREHGLRFCFYYSILDWHHPHYYPQNMNQGGPGIVLPEGVEPDMNVYVRYLKAQLRELLTGYGDVGLVWFDGPWETPWNETRGRDLYAYVRGLRPDVIVNDRVFRKAPGSSARASDDLPGDYDTPEQRIGAFQTTRPWETCMTLCRQWAWKSDDTMKSLEECLHTLIRCAAGDGNLLFNVGPMPDGRIEPRQVERLFEMGAWLEKHGETIYGTRGGPWRPGRWGGSTFAGRKIFLHVTNWPGNQLVLPAFAQHIVGARLRTGSGDVPWSQDERSVRVVVRPEDRDPIDTIVELEVAENVTELATPGDALSFLEDPRYGSWISKGARFEASSTSRWDHPEDHERLLSPAGEGPEFAFHTAIEERPWIVIDLGKSFEVTGIEITNRPLLPERAATLSLALSEDGDHWTEVWRAAKVETSWEVPMPGDATAAEPASRKARYLKLALAPKEPTALHLRRVRVFGR